MEHYFSPNPKSALKKQIFKSRILGNDIQVTSSSGIFSVREIDFGSRLLSENAKIQGKSVLDLGCGYGIIGISLKKKYPDIELSMTDINERAVRLAKENCALNGIEAQVLKSDLFSHPQLRENKFSTILTNPPFSAGRKVCFEFIEQSHSHLEKNGLFELVAPHNKGGEVLKRKMAEVFGNAGEIAKKAGYRVYISRK